MTYTDQPLILSVDDDENSHLLLRHALGKAGVIAKVAQCEDGVDAIRYISGEGDFSDRTLHPLPDLMLLDLKMPKCTGFDVLEFIQKNKPAKKFPIAVFSSSGEESDIEKAYGLGCDFYLIKPVNLAKLLELVAAVDAQFFNNPVSGELIPAFSRFNVRPRNITHKRIPPSDLSPETRYPADSPELFRLMVEQVKDYAIFMLNTDGRILSWNDGARRIKGYEAHEVIGKHFSIFYPQQDRDLDKPHFELKMAREMGRYEEEGWRVRKDGSRFWANVIVSPLTNEKNELQGYAKVTRDLTQRKIQEDNMQRLLESEERFRLLVDQVKDYAIFLLDAKGHVLTWNQGARRLKGYSTDEIVGKHFSVFYTAEDKAKDHPSYELGVAIREGRYEEEGWRIRKDGTRFWASVVLTSLWDKRGNLSGFAKVTRDLTQRKMQEDDLLRKTEELESFAHTLSHDLRSPVRSIISFGQLLESESTGLSPSHKSYLNKMLAAADTMDHLISDILELSKVSNTPGEQSILPLSDVFDEVFRIYESDTAKLPVQFEVRQPLPTIRANHTLVLQIFSNLIGNSLKFGRPGEKLHVEVFATFADDFCEIHVKDNGIGIEEKFRERIFNVFERGSADRKTSGSGVGLAIVKKAADRMGAEVSVESEFGKGSDFIVSFPNSLCLMEHHTLPSLQNS